jgi:hypothetical protein
VRGACCWGGDAELGAVASRAHVRTRYVGRLSGTKGTVWQYTAIDVASGFAWAELHTSTRNESSPRGGFFLEGRGLARRHQETRGQVCHK